MSSQIYYKKNTNFDISPTMNLNDVTKFRQYISFWQMEYKRIYIYDCYFWDYNESTNSIIINANNHAVEYDIFNQLMILIKWLFERNYHVEGSYYGRIGNFIEKITINSKINFLIHHILYDRIKTTFRDPTVILHDSKIKINKCIGTSVLDISKYNSDIGICNDENKLLIRSLQEKIRLIENDQKKQLAINKFFIRMFVAFGIITFGSICYLTHVI